MVAYTNYLTDARPRREAEALASRGDEVDFIALSEHGRPSNEKICGVHVRRLALVRYRGGSSTKYLLSYLAFFVAASVKTASLYLRKRFDVIHVHTMPDFMVFVALLPKILGAKVVIDLHDTMPELYMSKFGVSETHPIIRLMKLQERISFQFAHRIVSVHDQHRLLLIRRGATPEAVYVLPNVPDPVIFGERVVKPCEHDSNLRMIYHGTIANRLGLDIALDAFHQVVRHFPHARFDIMGDGDGSGAVQQKIKELRLEGNVNFSRRFFRIEEIPSIVRGASLGIVPNRRDPATELMLPVKMLEYMYLGVPVVAPRLQCIQYYFSHMAVAYFEPGDVSALAETIIDLYRNPAKRASMIANCQPFLDKFSWMNLRECLFKIVDE
jgi:glycosyltransferase involved in cell wall biosynthesis